MKLLRVENFAAVVAETTAEKSPPPMTPERQTKSKSAPTSPHVVALMGANRALLNPISDGAKELISAALRPQPNPEESAKDTTLKGG